MNAGSSPSTALPVPLGNYCCALCAAPGATALIARRKAGCCSASNGDADGVQVEVTVVCARHLPPACVRLPPRVREHAMTTVWRQIDEDSGRLGVSLRLPPVRRKVEARGTARDLVRRAAQSWVHVRSSWSLVAFGAKHSARAVWVWLVPVWGQALVLLSVRRKEAPSEAWPGRNPALDGSPAAASPPPAFDAGGRGR